MSSWACASWSIGHGAYPGWWMSPPISRVLFPGALRRSRSATIPLGVPSPTRSSGLPAGSGGPPSNACARLRTRGPADDLDLAPGGVYLATPVTRGAGGLLHHRFTLTGPAEARLAVCFLWHCPAARAGLPLTTTLPCGARTFLGDLFSDRRGRPADSSVWSVGTRVGSGQRRSARPGPDGLVRVEQGQIGGCPPGAPAGGIGRADPALHQVGEQFGEPVVDHAAAGGQDGEQLAAVG